MGRINKYSNGNWVNQHRKSHGEFQKKQDIEALLFNQELNNGNNIQEKNTPNIDDLIDDLPNIPAMLDYAPSQDSIEPIDGGTAHTPIARALLPILTALSAAPAIFPNITASSNKAISTDNQNSLLARVTSATGKMPILFDTTPATTSTSQNHDQPLIREKDGLILHNADGNIMLSNDGKKLTFSYHLNIDKLEQQLTNSNITELCLWAVKIDPQKVQEIGNFLKGSNVKVLSILHGSIEGINFGTMLTDTKVTTLNLAYNGIGNKSAIYLIKSLKGNVEELNLSHNRIGNTGKGAKGLITLLKKTNVKVLDLSDNNMSDEKVNNIIPELEKNTKIIELGLKDTGIEHNTLKKVLKVLKQNKHVNKESTSTIESSTTEKESSTEEDHTSNKREKRDIHTTDDETLQQESTVLTTDVSSTTTIESTTSATENSTTTEQETIPPIMEEFSTTTKRVTAASTSTTTKQETIPPITEEFSTTTKRVTAASTSTTTEQETIPPITEEFSTTTKRVTAASTSTTTEQETIPPIMEEFSTTTKRVTAASTSTTTEQETIPPITEEFSTTTKRVTAASTSTTTEQETIPPIMEEFSTTTTKSTASSAGNPTTDSATVWSNPQKTTTLKEEITTPKKNLTEKSEPIAADIVVGSITEKHTPKESNPNNPASSAMSIEKILGLISFAVTTIGVGGGVVIYAIKKFCGGVSHLGHEALALADLELVELDNRLDNNEETLSLTGITVNDDMD